MFLAKDNWFGPIASPQHVYLAVVYTHTYLEMDQLFQLHFEPLNSEPEGFNFEMTGKGCSPFVMHRKGGYCQTHSPCGCCQDFRENQL